MSDPNLTTAIEQISTTISFMTIVMSLCSFSIVLALFFYRSNHETNNRCGCEDDKSLKGE